MAVTSIPKSALKNLKKKIIAKLPWNKKYEQLPHASSHQEEVDENALNEALEARLMEIIASSPASDTPITINQRDLFSYGTYQPLVSTSCQVPQPQV